MNFKISNIPGNSVYINEQQFYKLINKKTFNTYKTKNLSQLQTVFVSIKQTNMITLLFKLKITSSNTGYYARNSLNCIKN